ncbi:hypothetical protein D3C81_609800 [compost metagenome]
MLGGEQAGPGLVVQVAGAGAAVFLAEEEAEVGAQHPVADRLAVLQLQVLLLVDVLQLGAPQADQGAIFIEAIFAADEVEAVGGSLGVGEQRHVFHARIIARAVLAELAAVEGQAGDFAGSDLRALEGLRQRAAVVGAQDRQHRHPFADLQLSLRNPRLARHRQAPVVIGRPPIVVARQQPGAVGAATAIELDRPQPQHIHAEPDRPFGETRTRIEDKALRPFLGLALRVAGVGEVAVDIEIAQAERGLGILDKARRHSGARQAAEQADAEQGKGEGLADFHYCCAPQKGVAARPPGTRERPAAGAGK